MLRPLAVALLIVLAAVAILPVDQAVTSTACAKPGPDRGGYVCTRPTFNLVPTTGGHTEVMLGDDQASAVAIGFSFTFYGLTYPTARISSNGFLSFNPNDSDSGCCNGQKLPDPETPNSLIAALWTDLNPDDNGHIYYETTGGVGNRVFKVDWIDVPTYMQQSNVDQFGDTPLGNTFQIAINELDGCILVQVDHAFPQPSHDIAIGLEDGGGHSGLLERFGNGLVLDELAYQFCPDPELAQPLTADLSVRGFVDDDDILFGAADSLDVLLENRGTNDATDVELTAKFPPNLGSLSVMDADGLSCSVDAEANAVTCTKATIVPNSLFGPTFGFTGVKSGSGRIQLSVTHTSDDVSTRDNKAKVDPVRVGKEGVDLVVSPSSADPVVVDGMRDVTFLVRNAGSNTADTGIVVAITFPTTVTPGTPPGECTQDGQVFTCTHATGLNPGDSYTLAFTGNTFTAVGQARFSALATPVDVEAKPADNKARLAVQVVPSALADIELEDIEIEDTTSGLHGILQVGDDVQVKLVVHNDGAGDATALKLTVKARGLEFDGIDVVGGTGVSTRVGSGSFSVMFDELTDGSSATITVSGIVTKAVDTDARFATKTLPRFSEAGGDEVSYVSYLPIV